MCGVDVCCAFACAWCGCVCVSVWCRRMHGVNVCVVYLHGVDVCVWCICGCVRVHCECVKLRVCGVSVRYVFVCGMWMCVVYLVWTYVLGMFVGMCMCTV